MHMLPLGLLALMLGACDNGDTTEAPSTPAAAAGGGEASTTSGEVLATVNGVNITVDEFESAAARKQPSEGSSLTASDKQEVLDKLVDEKLLYKAALTQGIDQDPKVQKVMVNTLLRQEVYASVRNSDFTDEELQSYYETNKEDFVVPAKVQIKRILIKVTDDRTDGDAKAEAERIHSEASSSPSSFKELAAKFSEDPYRRRGGDVGFVPKEGKPGLDQAVVDKAFSMDAEELSTVFKTDEGYNIVYVANKRERVERTFQQMKGSVLRKVKNERLKSLYESYVSNLKGSATVEIDEAKLGSLEIKSAKRSLGPGFSLDPSVGPSSITSGVGKPSLPARK